MHIGINLLFIIPGQNGGTQIYSESLIKALAELDTENTYTVFVSQEGAALEIPSQPNFHKVVCPVRSVRREARYAYEQIVFPWMLRQYHIDLVHSLGYVCPLLAPCANVVTICDLNYIAMRDSMPRGKRLFLSWFVRHSASRSDHVLTISEFSKRQMMQSLGTDTEKITVTYLGPRAASAAPMAAWQETAARYQIRAPYLLAFSSLSPHKNIKRLLQAYAQICSDLPQQLLLVGHLPEGVDLRAELGRLGIAERVIVTGYVPDADVMPLLEHADLFLFPSLYEGFGLPILDAQAAGVAVACSTAASLPEVAGEGAALFDPLSVDEMGAVILDCLRDADRRDDLIQKGRANVARFSWKSTAAATLACYRTTLDQQTKAHKQR